MKYMCIFIMDLIIVFFIEIIMLKYVIKNINTLTIGEVLNIINEEN